MFVQWLHRPVRTLRARTPTACTFAGAFQSTPSRSNVRGAFSAGVTTAPLRAALAPVTDGTDWAKSLARGAAEAPLGTPRTTPIATTPMTRRITGCNTASRPSVAGDVQVFF